MRFVFALILLTAYLRCAAQVHEAIAIADLPGIETARKELRSLLFEDELTPLLVMDTDAVVSQLLYYPSENINRIETGVVTLKYGATSRIYHFIPQVSNGLKLPVIYHAGHLYGVAIEDNYINDTHADTFPVRVIDYFLAKGFDVFGIDMPMVGQNYFPDTVIENDSAYAIGGHDQIMSLKNPFYYFLMPIQSTIDFLEKSYGYKKFIMMGLSGGGWSTTVYSALDTRVVQSYPVAGSVPIPLRTLSRDWGDAEQNDPMLYDRFNYSTLYFLAATGEGRLHYQILNQHDDCCFAIDGNLNWVPDVDSAILKSGVPGDYKFFFDPVALTHHITSVTVDTISYHVINDLANKVLKGDIYLVTEDNLKTICDNDTLLLSVQGGTSNVTSWYRDGILLQDSTLDTIRVYEEGHYYARVKNISGAEAVTDTIFLRKANVLQKPTIQVQGQGLSSSSPTGNEWYFNDQLLSNDTSASLVLSKPGKYTLRLVLNHCISDFSEPYFFGVSAFPNPAKSYITITVPTEASAVDYAIITMTGQLLMKGTFVGQTTVQISERLAEGLYLIRLTNKKDFKATKKIWIRR